MKNKGAEGFEKYLGDKLYNRMKEESKMKMKTRLFGVLMVVFAFTSFVFISNALAGGINIKGSGTNDAKLKIDSVEGGPSKC